MLYTRCPDCLTTFRITVDILHQAEGQVRCGRCEVVFNAFEQLADGVPQEERQLAQQHADILQSNEHLSAHELAALAGDAIGSADPGYFEIEDALGKEVLIEPADEAETRAESAAAPEFEIEWPEEAEAMPALDVDEEPRISDAEVERVLAAEAQAQAADDDEASPWPFEPIAPENPRRGLWTTACVLAVIALLIQGIHFYRFEILDTRPVGEWLGQVYEKLGQPLTDPSRLDAYEIVDWTATAQAEDNGPEGLFIVAQIRNYASGSQPYPHVHIVLTDRWGAEIGSRIFRPEEYAQTNANGQLVMAAGATARARFELIDPGTQASGFGLDLCVDVGNGELACKADQIFQ